MVYPGDRDAMDNARISEDEAELGQARFVLAVLVVVYIANTIDRQILSILLEPIKLELGVSDSMMGLLVGPAFAFVYAFAGIPIARFADRNSRVAIISAGLTIWSVLTAACGLVHSFIALALMRVGVGGGEASCSPAAHSLIADYFPPARRATALAIYAMGANIGSLFGFLIGGWMAEFFGWRNAFFVVGLPGVALALFVWMTVREPRRGLSEGVRSPARPDGAASAASFLEVVRHLFALASFRHLAIMGGLYSIAIFSILSWSATFLQRVHGMSPGESGSWLGLVVGLGMAVGTLLSGTLSDRLGARDVRWQLWIAVIGGMLAIPFLFLFLVLPNAHDALIALIPAMVAFPLHVAALYALTQALAPIRMRAQAAAVMLFILNFIGNGIGSWSIGIASDMLSGRYGRDSLRYALFIALVATLFACFHALLAARSVREDLKRVSA